MNTGYTTDCSAKQDDGDGVRASPRRACGTWVTTLQSVVDKASVRRFARRDWPAVARAKIDYWAEQYRLRGPAAARQAATHLWQHARVVRPGFPDDAERSRDLAGHLDLRERLDRAARAFAGR